MFFKIYFRFYLPHGLTVDHQKNIWVTDVALHQIFKFKALNFSKAEDLQSPVLTLGTSWKPGHSVNQFCKPTSVAVDAISGDFFVSDGYCNSRIIKYDKNGKFLSQWEKHTARKLNYSTY